MTILQYLIHPVHGCCTTGELMSLSKSDRQGYDTLRKWAEEEMKLKGIPMDVTEPKK
jgi:hypothetical protein